MSLTNSYAEWLKAGLRKYLRAFSYSTSSDYRLLEIGAPVKPPRLHSRERWDNVDAFMTWRYPELYKGKNGKKGTKRVWKSDIYCVETIPSASSTQTQTNRPTGQVVLVTTPSHTPYSVVTNCGEVEHVEEYNFGILGNVTPGDALDDALSSRTTSSLDRNHRSTKKRKEGMWSSAEKNWDGDDNVSEVVTPVRLGYEHSPTGKFRDFTTLPSATMHGYVEHGAEYLEMLRHSELEFGPAEDIVENFLLREFQTAYLNASKVDDNMSDRKLAAWIRASYKGRSWEYPLRHPVLTFFPGAAPRSDFARQKMTQYLRHTTTD